MNYTISIIGLLLSIYAVYQTFKIKKLYKMKVRLPELTNDLEMRLSTISKALNEKNWQDNKGKIIEELSRFKGQLENVTSKLNGDIKKEVLSLISKFEKKNQWDQKLNLISKLSNKQAWAYYSDMCIVVTKLTELEKDVKWD